MRQDVVRIIADRRVMARMVEALDVIRKEAPEIPIQIIMTFLGIVAWGDDDENPLQEPTSYRELSRRLDIPPASIARHLRYLGPFVRPGVEGAGFVETSDWIQDRRFRIVRLTPKGRRVANRISTILGGQQTGGGKEGHE